MQFRQIPEGTVIKTGTLNQVSALAGLIPTKERGSVWFVIINNGNGIEEFRTEQDKFLQKLAQHWQFIAPTTTVSNTSNPYLGDPNRNLKFEG
jgi:D-alanyl-D-alanine carboxypeptidase/D-alanyl-D-alanine-endopeptidase (penicillin-binding protein 4)